MARTLWREGILAWGNDLCFVRWRAIDARLHANEERRHGQKQ